VQLSSDVLDLFAQYWWPGNVRQLRNEVQRAVAMAPPGGVVGPEHLSADLTAAPASRNDVPTSRVVLRGGQTLAVA
jgi:transcriptional regulator with PAS, ATPase and Fis domain